jgi:hypothetical protein
MGTGPALPADFRVDKPATVRTVGTYASALSATSLLGGANLSTSASNGIYNFSSGAVSGTDRAVGFLSSGTATQSGNLYTQLVNNTGGSLSGLQISYNVEKYRNGSNANGFRIQMFYSTDGSTWTSAGSDFLTSFAADANNNGFAIAPGATVPISNKTLAVAIPNGGNFYLAWNYSVASGTTTTNAQALAIDDISILGIPGSTPTNPTASGAATPSTVQVGNSTVLTVTVAAGLNPTSSGLAVSADLTSIGGSAAQPLYDDGTHGDVTAGDNVFSFQAAVPAGNALGPVSLPVSVTDAQSRSASTSIGLNVISASTNPVAVGSANPSSLQQGNPTLLTVNVTPGANPTSTGLSIFGNLQSIGGAVSQQFFDDGTHGDATAGDNIFSFSINIASGTTPGTKSLPITITDAQARTASSSIALTIQPPPPPTTVKISQVYGGGGNSGATYFNDFVEVFNQDTNPIDLTGWSVQYSSATASSWAATSICPSGPCIVLPGHYFLVQLAAGAGGTTSLPAADAIGTTNMGAPAGKVALVANSTALVGSCPTGGAIVDLVGYGSTASCSETSPTPTLSNTSAAVRKGNGCVDTDNNANDFVTIGPIPRNSAAPPNTCGGNPAQPSGVGVASPASLEPASNTTLSVAVTPATVPPSTGLAVSADLTSIGTPGVQPFYDDATHGDLNLGDKTFSLQTTVGAFIPTGVKNIVATITDAEGRTATAPITISIQSPTCGVERWSVKTGTDADAALVNLLNPVRGQIAELGQIPAPPDPPGPPLNARVLPTESTVYVLNATMILYKKESDVDYHIVLQDENGKTLVAEIPSPACVGPTSPFGTMVASARANFDNHFIAGGNFQSVSVPVQVKGVGFFDFIHGQTGVAPNGIELHPVLEINFTANSTTALSSNLNPSIYGQSVVITATVSNGTATTPTGKVTFKDGGAAIGTADLGPDGKANFNLSGLSTGTHSITASYEGDSTSSISNSAELLQVVNKADQTITFGPLAGKTFGDADFSVSANASSSLPVSFSIFSGPASIAGNIVHITGAGTVDVRASQGGDTNYNAADDVDRSFDVAMANQSITFAALGNKTFGDAPFTVSASGGASGNPVTFAASGNCSSSGLNGSTITITSGGSCTVTASQAGNGNYKAALDVPRTFTVNAATATVSVIGYSGVYDGLTHGASGGATGVNGENLSALLNLGASFTNVPGGVANWSFVGNASYSATSGTAAIVITKATPSFSNLSSPAITTGAANTSLSGKISLGALVPTGSVLITLNGVTQSAAIQPDGSFSSNFNTGSLAPSDPAYNIGYSYAGDINFNSMSSSGTLTVSFGEKLLYDPTKAVNSGSTLPLKIQLSNAAGADVSSASIVITAVGLVQVSSNATYDVQDSGNANPDDVFRFDPTLGPTGGYIFNLSTKGLTIGTYNLIYTVQGDPVQHSLSFQIR